jgi:amino acid transporter
MIDDNPFEASSSAAELEESWSVPSGSFSDVEKPPRAPLFLGLVFFLTSLVLVGLQNFGVLPSSSQIAVASVAYLLTPFLVMVCVIWLRFIDVRKRSNMWYDAYAAKRQMRLLGVLALASFLVALLPIYWLAQYLSDL